MNYFKAIAKRADELNELGNAYLKTLPFMSNDIICERLWKLAYEIFDEDKDDNPDWVVSTVDGCIPFASQSRNGSIYYSLGFAVAAQDARLRNLLELVEGRTTEELTFPTLAEKEIVSSYVSE